MENEIKYSDEIEKVVNAKNTECLLCDTEACRYLNAENCGECAVGSLKKEKQERAKAALERLSAAAPAELTSELFLGGSCLFCKGEDKGPAECFAMFDLSKPDPEGNWSVALGKRSLEVKGADMILPLQVNCCRRCRRAYRLYDWLPVFAALAISAIGLAVTTAKPVYTAAYKMASWLPVAMLAGFAAFGAIVALILKLILGSVMKKRMHTDVAEIPEVKALMDCGFEEVAEKKRGVSRLVFASERRRYGVATRIPEVEPAIMGIWPAEHFGDFEGDGEAPHENCGETAVNEASEAVEEAAAEAVNEASEAAEEAAEEASGVIEE